MKQKTLTLFSVGILALLVCLSLVSAATTFSVSPSSIDFSIENSGSRDITITNPSSTELLDVTVGTLMIGDLTFTVSGETTAINGSSVITLTPNNLDFSEIDVLEELSGVLTITDASDSNEVENITVNINTDDFCDYDNIDGDLEVRIEDVNNQGLGDDETWYPLDVIKIQVEIENSANDDVDDISLEWGLYSKETDSWVIDFDEEDSFDLSDDETEDLSFEIDLEDDLSVDMDELEDGDYVLYVRATGEVDRTGKPKSCAEDSESIDIKIEKNYVVLDDLEVVGSTFCGSTVQLTADIWNLGSKDQDDVSIRIINSDLELDENVILSSIDAFDDKKLNVEFTIPEKTEEKTYYISLRVFDEDGDIYESESESSMLFPLSVSGNCELTPEARILASLESGGKTGQEMEIRATVTNEESTSETFEIKAGDYSSWAELVSISPASVTLNSGESTDVIITLNVDKDADALESFQILVESADGGVLSQPIEVAIDKGFSLSGMFGDNGYIWGIAILNIVLVLVIIIIAIRVARR